MICFAWDGFPQYAARCIHAFVESAEERVVVLATHPSVPIVGMEALCGCEVIWVERDQPLNVDETLRELPRILVLSGWYVPTFNHLRDDVRRAGGRAICMCDNNFMLSPKEWIKALRFRLCFRGKYDGFFVPGMSGVRLLRLYGVPRNKIATGMYSADASLFRNGLPLGKREKKIIYVGQFIGRKNVLRLVEAFAAAATKTEGGWSLDLYGSGVLRDELTSRAEVANVRLKSVNCKIEVHDFVQPEQLAALYRDARIFCLPSLWEHWGLVIHEAALSGCVLVLGNKTGAGEDLLVRNEKGIDYINGFVFNPASTQEMANVLLQAMQMDDDALRKANEASLQVAKSVSLDGFVKGVNELATGMNSSARLLRPSR